MRLVRQSDGTRVAVDVSASLGKGGEARVFPVLDQKQWCAKVYHTPAETQARKLQAMLSNPPEDPMSARDHISIAWPVDLLRYMYNGQGLAGFLMPRVEAMRPVFSVYNPMTRRQNTPLFNWLYLHRAARNMAAAIRALHQRGYVVGDINESNILVSDTALVTLVDCDSFQVRDQERGRVYRCMVGKPEFTPPELQNKNFRLVDRLPEHDRFGMAALIFLMLMEGTHPFAGIYQGEGEPPPHEERISKGHYTYSSSPVPYRPMPFAPPVGMLHPSLRQLFSRCFEQGCFDPQSRPLPEEWMAALQQAEENLLPCSVNPLHMYGSHLPGCPWCERTELLGGRDPFPPTTQEPMKKTPKEVYPEKPAVRYQGARIVGGRAAAVLAAPAAAVQNPIAAIPSYAPTFQVSSAPAPSITIPDYSPFTWLAGTFALVSAILPGFQIFFGVLALLCGVPALRDKRKGRWLALASTLLAGAVVLTLVTLRLRDYFVKTPARAIIEQGPIESLAFAPGGHIIAVATGRNEDQRLIPGEVSIYNTRTGEPVNFLDGVDDETSVAYSSDGRLLAAGTGGSMMPGMVEIWNTRHFVVMQKIRNFQGDVTGLQFSPDSKTIATGCRGKTIALWNVATGEQLWSRTAPGQVFDIAFSPSGRLLAAATGSTSSGQPGRVSVYSASSAALLWSHRAHSDRATSVAFSPDGRYLASAGNDNAVRVWNPATGKRLWMLNVADAQALGSVAFSPHGKRLAAGGNDGAVRVWAVPGGTLLQRFVVKNPGSRSDLLIQHIAFAQDGHFVAGGSEGGTLHLWRLKAAGKPHEGAGG